MPNPTLVPWSVLGVGIDSKQEKWRTIVAQDLNQLSDLADLVRSNNPLIELFSELDLSKQTVIGVFSGQQPTLQCKVTVDEVYTTGSNRQIYVTKHDIGGQEAIGYPYCVIQLKKHVGEIIVYSRNLTGYHITERK